jgi:hypothetical protein
LRAVLVAAGKVDDEHGALGKRALRRGPIERPNLLVACGSQASGELRRETALPQQNVSANAETDVCRLGEATFSKKAAPLLRVPTHAGCRWNGESILAPRQRSRLDARHDLPKKGGPR